MDNATSVGHLAEHQHILHNRIKLTSMPEDHYGVLQASNQLGSIDVIAIPYLLQDLQMWHR